MINTKIHCLVYERKDSFVGTNIRVYHAHYEDNLLGKTIDYYYPKYNKKKIKYETAEDAARAGWTWEKKQLFRTIGEIKE